MTRLGGKSLNLAGLRFKTLGLALVFLVMIVLVAEMAVRSAFLQSWLPPASVGGNHRDLDIKIDRLDKFVSKYGRVDCVFLGSSKTNRGIVPKTFLKIYEKNNNTEYLSFNLGLRGVGISGSLKVAEIVLQDYHPNMLVFEMGVVSLLQGKNKKIAENRWLRYRQGYFDIAGCFLEHFHSYRYILRLLIWLKQEVYSKKLVKKCSNLTEAGYEYASPEKFQVKTTHKMERRIEGDITRFRYRRMRKMLTLLESFVDRWPEVEIIFVDVPVHRNLSLLFEKDRPDLSQKYHYKKVKTAMMKLIKRKRIGFFPTMGELDIPDRGWKDPRHLNITGATMFSTWLGEQIAAHCREQSQDHVKH